MAILVNFQIAMRVYGYDLRNKEEIILIEHILEFTVAHNLILVLYSYSYLTKKDNHLIIYQSGSVSSQIDYIFAIRSDFYKSYSRRRSGNTTTNAC